MKRTSSEVARKVSTFCLGHYAGEIWEDPGLDHRCRTRHAMWFKAGKLMAYISVFWKGRDISTELMVLVQEDEWPPRQLLFHNVYPSPYDPTNCDMPLSGMTLPEFKRNLMFGREAATRAYLTDIFKAVSADPAAIEKALRAIRQQPTSRFGAFMRRLFG